MYREVIKDKAESGTIRIEGLSQYLNESCSLIDENNKPWIYTISPNIFKDIVTPVGVPVSVIDNKIIVTKALNLPIRRIYKLQENFSQIDDTSLLEKLRNYIIQYKYKFLLSVLEIRPSSINGDYVENYIKYVLRGCTDEGVPVV